MNLILNPGITKDLIIRADVNSAVDGDTATLSLNSAIENFEIYENNSAILVDDIFPTFLTFNAVTIQAPAITVTTNPLSTALSAVVGSSNIQVLSFNLKANDTDDLKVTNLEIADESSDTMSSAIISQIRLFKDGESVAVKAISGSDIAADVVTFDNLALNVPKGQSVKYYATIDLVSDNTYNGTTTKWGLVDIAAEDKTEGAALATSTAFTVAVDSGRTVTIVGSGSLLVEMDNANADTLKDRYEIAGTNSGLLAAVKLRAANESVNVEDLAVAIYSSVGTLNTNADKVWSKIQLIDSDKTTVLKEIEGISASTTFEDVNIVVPKTGTKTVYVKGVLNLIGKDQVGVYDNTSLFAISDVVAKGVDSSVELTNATTSTSSAACATAGKVCYATDGSDTLVTDVSKAVTALASKISSVDLVSSGGGCTVASSLSAGWNTVSVIKVVTDNNDNTLSTGDEVKTILNTITVDRSEVGATSTLITIERCGGTGAALTDSASTTASVSFDLSSWATDDEIAKSGTAYYAVKFYISEISATAGAASVQVDLNNLDSASAGTANIEWYDSSDAGAAEKYPLRLSVNKVTGSKISN
jgi:hypothetical protein